MLFPILLFALAFVALAIALFIPGLTDLVLLAAVLFLSGAYLLLPHLRRRPRRWVVVDGSNVMHWKDNAPQLQTLREVLDALARAGFAPGVVFDANAGYLIAGRYLNERALGAMLGLPLNRVLVVDKGMPADPLVLAAARDFGARVVSNDRFRDWEEAHPEIREEGYLIRGGYRDGKLWLGV